MRFPLSFWFGWKVIIWYFAALFVFLWVTAHISFSSSLYWFIPAMFWMISEEAQKSEIIWLFLQIAVSSAIDPSFFGCSMLRLLCSRPWSIDRLGSFEWNSSLSLITIGNALSVFYRSTQSASNDSNREYWTFWLLQLSSVCIFLFLYWLLEPKRPSFSRITSILFYWHLFTSKCLWSFECRLIVVCFFLAIIFVE